MTYASTSIDRRADYYARCAELIAADPLDFYTRAERGRRIQASNIKHYDTQPRAAQVAGTSRVPKALSDGVAWLSEGKSNTSNRDSQPQFATGAIAA